MFPTFTATGTFRGQTREWTLQVRDGTLEFWDATRDEPQQWRFAAWHPVHERDVAAWTRDALESLWRDALERENVGRRVELSDELTIFLRDRKWEHDFVWFKGKHQVIEKRVFFNSGKQIFEWSHERWVQETEWSPTPYCSHSLDECLNKEGIPFIYGFCGDEREYEPEKIALKKGDLEEFSKVAEWVWKLEPQWILKYNEILSGSIEFVAFLLVLHVGKPARAYTCVCDQHFGLIGEEHPRALLWNELLRFFNPCSDPIAHQKDIESGARVFRVPLALPKNWGFFNFETGELSEITHHEQMELRLSLRDWLRARAGLSDERIAELLF